MKWSETIAVQCRYGDVAERIFRDAVVIYEHSEADYQGYANVLAALPDGTFVHYEWSYGSCSGCDEWEQRRLSDDQIEKEMRSAMAVLPDLETVRRYLHLDPDFVTNMNYPSANTPTNGSIPGMLRQLSGSVSQDFEEMGKALEQMYGGKP